MTAAKYAAVNPAAPEPSTATSFSSVEGCNDDDDDDADDTIILLCRPSLAGGGAIIV